MDDTIHCVFYSSCKEGTRIIKCNSPVDYCRRRLDGGEPLFSPKAKMQTSPFRCTPFCERRQRLERGQIATSPFRCTPPIGRQENGLPRRCAPRNDILSCSFAQKYLILLDFPSNPIRTIAPEKRGYPTGYPLFMYDLDYTQPRVLTAFTTRLIATT